jgi:hypothetical protein
LYIKLFCLRIEYPNEKSSFQAAFEYEFKTKTGEDAKEWRDIEIYGHDGNDEDALLCESNIGPNSIIQILKRKKKKKNPIDGK